MKLESSLKYDGDVVLSVTQLDVHARFNKQNQPIIHGVTFEIKKGQTFALVGESGSGKSITASAIAGLLPKALSIKEGHIHFQGKNILDLPLRQRRQLRGRHIGFVFQDYQGSFTPFIKIGKQLVEMILSHKKLPHGEVRRLVLSWLVRVDLPAERVFASYPFQLSGGQRQRIALAAALMLEPALLVADEPTTALDVLTGKLILDLMEELQVQTGCAILLISHDLRQVLQRADHIAVMQNGEIVEKGNTELIRHRAAHPYTQKLLEASPKLTGKLKTEKHVKELVLTE